VAKKNIPVLMFANKMDLADAVDPSDVKVALKLDDLATKHGKEIRIMPTNGLRGDGVKQGIDWIASRMRALANFEPL